MSDAQQDFSGVKDVAEAHRFDEDRLAEWMKDNVGGYAGPLTVRQFKGGQSNPTYRLDTPDQSYVLRRKPPGQLLRSAHAVDREFRVMSALADTDVPVPVMRALCTDDEIIGSWFYIMDFIEGRIFWDPYLPDLVAEERGAIYDSMNMTLAALHGGAGADLARRQYEGYIAMLACALRAADAQVHDEASLDVLAGAMVAMMDGLILQFLATGDAHAVKARLDAAVAMLRAQTDGATS